ncbi:mitochondrial 28S ribosomal protein S14, putative [Pediculus humanus corporis]|uniref:Small ribosomal subunit protein uS14 n=1 Tax=Pediculus humanus subsp. corporis TaxID=121224 RepID=E0VFT9_PEDHC|nr:mitochondrial 28S ribosomal protein S14, putative [Pediculus humanus corporis]EEB12245.1 mitochondrial 28S ribosomal protein S14, putative [Pediculus humanus corporis]
MLKDYNKRQRLKKYGKERLRINALRKNKILPPELKALADEEIAALPRSSSIVQINNRCSLTSRPRGTVNYFRVSRIMFRHFADYNKLAGVIRAQW